VGLTERLARACAAHPWRTLAAWGLALLASVLALALLLTGFTTEALATNNPESERADERLVAAFPPQPESTVTDVIVVRSSRHTVDDPEFEQFVRGLDSELAATNAIVTRQLYYTMERPSPSLVSRDRHALLVPIFLADDSGGAEAVIERVEEANANREFDAGITGNQTRDHDFNHLSERDLQNGELKFGLPAALIILLLVFGAVVAGLVPLAMALVSILTALGLVALISQVYDFSIFTVNMLTGMGLALGIDYSLFVISRYREERGHEREPFDAIAGAGATASRAVLFSGSAFVVAMFGLLLVPSSIFHSLAAGAILVGITSVLAALTLMPAILGLLRDRVDALRIPFLGRTAGDESRFWHAVIERVLRRPAVSLAVSTAALLALALPVLDLSIGAAGVSTLPDDLASKQGYLALQRSFPNQTTDPVHVVVANTTPEVRRRLGRLQSELEGDPQFGPSRVRAGRDGVHDLEVPVGGDPAGEQAVGAVRDLRDRIVPPTFAGTDADPLVGGTTSENIDYFDGVTNPAPLVFAFVLGLSFVLLTVAFRSVAIALVAILLNLLSVGAAYGLLVLVFQHGVGADLFGFQQVDTIEAWVPLFLFAVLFGLSMDYQVFLLSRIRERYDRTHDTRDAVSYGVSSTARIITGAALIIVAVFSGFARGDLVMFQQMGFGVAVALLLDATVIRSVVLPSAMALLGDRSWYLPNWLDWLPHFEVEGHAAQEAR
jgi:putative drug exporter of the RND superfamily